MFNTSLCRYRHWTYLFGKLMLGKKACLWSKINPSIKDVKTSSSFIHALKKNIFLHLQTKTNSNNYIILMIDIIIEFSHKNIAFLVIISILSSRSSNLNLVFPLIFSYTSKGTLIETSTFRSFFSFIADISS